MSSTYRRQLRAVLDQADFGDAVDVDSSNWTTPFGPIARTYTDGQELMGVGPIIMVRRSRTLDIFGDVPQPLNTKLRFDEKKRLYLTVAAENGSWTWRLFDSNYVSDVDGHRAYIGRWPD